MVDRSRAKHDQGLTYPMRRKPGTTSVTRINTANQRRRCVGESRGRGHLHCRPHSADRPQVVDDFREVMPVTQRELEIIETYLGAVLDDTLKSME
jgi:hypothetical protein